MYIPERDVSPCSDESDVLDFDKNESKECSEGNVTKLGTLIGVNVRTGLWENKR